jgi:predicted RecA/RadA family phage recombinase
MAQTPCIKWATGESIDYTPVTAKAAGTVVVTGTRLVGITPLDIAANELGSLDLVGTWKVPKVTGTITIGSALYWDDDADPLNGTAGSGAFTTTSSLGPFAGWAVETSSGNTILLSLQSRDASTTTARSALGQDNAQPYPVLQEDWYIFDSTTHAPLGATAISADDLIYTYGTAGTAEATIKATDFGGTSTTQKARIRVKLPVEYVAGQAITLRANAGMLTTVSHQTCTIDFNVYRAAAPTVDICATSAQSINSLTAANKDFTITPTDCVPGDILDILMTVAGTDDTDAGVMVPVVNQVTLLLSVKG